MTESFLIHMDPCSPRDRGARLGEILGNNAVMSGNGNRLD